jgi:mRNA-degrading endonuclease RelE of RelBE toxin-antitoxin system
VARIVLGQRARRELAALDGWIADAVAESLGLLQREPYAGRPLRGRLRGLLVLKVGSYRILYLLADGGRTVRVAAIRHRAAAYGKDPR